MAYSVESGTTQYIHTVTHTHTHIYIYNYMKYAYCLQRQRLPPAWIHMASEFQWHSILGKSIKGQGVEDRLWLWKGLQIASKGHNNWFESSVVMSDFKCILQSQLRHACLLSISDIFGYQWSLVVYRQTWLIMFDRKRQGAPIAISTLEIKEDVWCTSVPWHFCFESLFLAFGKRVITKNHYIWQKIGRLHWRASVCLHISNIQLADLKCRTRLPNLESAHVSTTCVSPISF